MFHTSLFAGSCDVSWKSLAFSLDIVAELGVLDILSLLFLADIVFLFFSESILSSTFGVAFPPFSFFTFLDCSSSLNLSCSIFHAYSKYMRMRPKVKSCKQKICVNINVMVNSSLWESPLLYMVHMCLKLESLKGNN